MCPDEIHAPPPTGPPQRPQGTPTAVDTAQVPAAPDPLAAAAAGPRERGRLRRQLRRLERVRAKQLHDLGTLVVDARRRADGAKPEVVERRAADAAEVDSQVRALAHAVDVHADSRRIATGVAGSCAGCGMLLATEDRFCPSCGTPAKPGTARPAEPASESAPQFAHVDPASIPPPPPPG